jgi:argininosuccinate lyase
MPGYTHLQHAQPMTLGHYLLSIHDHLQRDSRRLLAAYDTTDQCTLGCGAMSGTSLAVDRERVKDLLGFKSLCENTNDSVSASDHVTETAAALAGLMTLLGRFCQDLYVWSSQEFAMIDVTDAFSSPSSLMPQKKNALVLEYVRSRTARAIGALTSCFAVQHNVGYMDTEEVEIEVYRPLFEALTLTEEALPTVEALITKLEPNRALMRERAAWGFSSVTALAEAIQVRKALSYRTAHRIVARAVLLAVEQGKDAMGIDARLLDQAGEEMIGRGVGLEEEVIRAALDPQRFVAQHRVAGATAPAEVHRMVASRRAGLDRDREQLAQRDGVVAAGRERLADAVAAVMRAGRSRS